MYTKPQSTDDEGHEQAICSSDAHMLILFHFSPKVLSTVFLTFLWLIQYFVGSVEEIRIFCFSAKFDFPSASDRFLYSADSEKVLSFLTHEKL